MHLSKDRIPLAIKNLSRIIKPEGRILISVPTVRNDVNPETLRDRYGRLCNNFSPNLYTEMFKMVGFKVLFLEENKDAMNRKFNWVTIGFIKE